MHPKIYKEFEKIMKKREICGKVLELGAIASSQSLLASKVLSGCYKVGVNLLNLGKYEDFEIIQGNANNMDMIEDESYDAVLCNAMLEHDKFFWKSISEMRRVLKKGGILIIGVPSYKNFWFHKITSKVRGLNPISDFLRNSTFSFKFHSAPGDYYRFSEQAMNDVFFEGFVDVQKSTLMIPTRTIMHGVKK